VLAELEIDQHRRARSTSPHTPTPAMMPSDDKDEESYSNQKEVREELKTMDQMHEVLDEQNVQEIDGEEEAEMGEVTLAMMDESAFQEFFLYGDSTFASSDESEHEEEMETEEMLRSFSSEDETPELAAEPARLLGQRETPRWAGRKRTLEESVGPSTAAMLDVAQHPPKRQCLKNSEEERKELATAMRKYLKEYIKDCFHPSRNEDLFAEERKRRAQKKGNEQDGSAQPFWKDPEYVSAAGTKQIRDKETEKERGPDKWSKLHPSTLPTAIRSAVRTTLAGAHDRLHESANAFNERTAAKAKRIAERAQGTVITARRRLFAPTEQDRAEMALEREIWLDNLRSWRGYLRI
jgi:hypothetical protein